MDTTYRLIALNDRNNYGQTAATPELAKLVPGDLNRSNQRWALSARIGWRATTR